MVLSITGSSVFIGDPATTGQIEFLPTDMDAVDAHGKPTREKLLIARTLHTHESRNRINNHLLARGETYGEMEMYEGGTAYVVGRGYKNPPSFVRRFSVMDVGDDRDTFHSLKWGIQFVPDGALILADPNFAKHPAVNMTWYESASQAAALEDAHREATGQVVRVRMMRDPEVTRFITWDGRYTKKEVIAGAHLQRQGVTGTASVVGEAAALRTTPEGFVDPLGNVWIWTDGVARPVTRASIDTDDMDIISRIVRGTSWFCEPPEAHVDLRHTYRPGRPSGDLGGVRFVAVIR